MPTSPPPPIDDPDPTESQERAACTGETDGAAETTASPRAFAIRTGGLCQTVGLTFLFGACCLWSLSGRLVVQANQPAEHWIDYLTGDRLPAAVLTLDVAVTLVGGLGLLAAGIGLYGEKRGSGTVAAVTAGAMSAVYWASCLAFALRTGSWASSLTAAAFGVVSTLLFLLSLHSAAILRKFPPSPDQNVVTDEFLERYQRERRERRNRSS